MDNPMRIFVDMMLVLVMAAIIAGGETGPVAWLAFSLSIALALWRGYDEWQKHRVKIILTKKSFYHKNRDESQESQHDEILCIYLRIGTIPVTVDGIWFTDQSGKKLGTDFMGHPSSFTYEKPTFEPIVFVESLVLLPKSRKVRAHISYVSSKKGTAKSKYLSRDIVLKTEGVFVEPVFKEESGPAPF
jgi:hypothetical protein